ncbi:MAG: shikimate dehydrogenase [Lachnospiraceae bacterium]|nr:shikimate dehydrogenase [Lachnospiraceae bacterium]
MSFEITSRTGLLGLLGHPVGHSVSPFIQNSLAEHFGHDLRYLAYDVEPDALEAAVKGAYALKIRGLNVTVPHKQAVRAFLAYEDEAAARIGAVNTLKREADGWHGYNTDMPGFLRALKSDGINLKGRNVVVLGAGGAARAIVSAVLESEAKKLFIYNRTYEKAAEMAAYFTSEYPGSCIVALSAIDELTAAMKAEETQFAAINTTSAGMYPNVDDKPVDDEEFYRLCDTGVDIIFNPLRTAFMKAVEDAKEGNRAVNGLKMLLFQGVRSYEIWNDVEVPDEVAMKIYAGLTDLLSS